MKHQLACPARAGRPLRTVAVTLAVLVAAWASAQTITVATHYNEEQIAPVLQCVVEYETLNPGVDVDFQQISYGDYLQTILTARIAGQAPDIYHLYSIWGPQMVSNSVLATPPADIQAWLDDSYVASTLDAARIDGTLWGVPTEVSNYMLIYNKQLLADAGYSAPPTTWEELTEMAEAITQRDAQGNITLAGYAWGRTVAEVTHPFLTLLYSRGIQPYADDFRSTNLTSPEAVAVLESQVELYRRGITDATVEIDDFAASAVAMITMATWYRSTLASAFGDAFEETVGVAQIPGGDDWRSLQYAFFYGVDGNSQNQEAAWAFLRWLNTPRDDGAPSCMGGMLFDLGALTGNVDDLALGGDRLDDHFTAPFAAALDRSVPEPVVMNASEIGGVLRTWIQRAWLGELTAAEALEGADREITAILREFY